MAAVSPTIGSATGTPFGFRCSRGAFISRLDGGADDMVRGLKATCSNGAVSPVFGSATAGTQWTDAGSQYGYKNWVEARGSPAGVTGLQMIRTDGSQTPYHGSLGGTYVPWSGCPPGKVVTGITGDSTSNGIGSLSFICDIASTVAAPPPQQSLVATSNIAYLPPSEYAAVIAKRDAESAAHQAASAMTVPQSAPMSTGFMLLMVFIFLVFLAILGYAAMRWMQKRNAGPEVL